MENEFKIDNNYIDEATKCARNAKSYIDGLDTRLKKIDALNLDIINYNSGNINENIKLFNNINSIEREINNVKKEAMKSILSFENFQEQLPTWIAEGKITAEDLVSLSGDYMEDLVMNNPNYSKGFKTANSLQDVLRGVGFSEEFIDSLSKAFCVDLINKDLMYSREGIVEMAYNFNGLLAMYGWKLTYGPDVGGHFDNLNHGLYLGTKESDLKYMDCCNYYDWLCRCVGIDAFAYGAGAHYNYAKDIEGYANPTPKDEYYARSDSEYFTKGKPGDIVETNKDGHLRVIVKNDGRGYLMTESTGIGVVYRYYEYDDLGGYHVSNMDAVYRNTSSGKIGMFRDIYGDPYNNYYQADLDEAKRLRGDGIFFSPEELANELGLDDELKNKLIIQYNKRNEHPNIPKISEILDTEQSNIPNDSKLPNLEEIVPENNDTVNDSVTNTIQTDKPINPSPQNENTGSGTEGVSSTKPEVSSKPSKPNPSPSGIGNKPIESTDSSKQEETKPLPEQTVPSKDPEYVMPNTSSKPNDKPSITEKPSYRPNNGGGSYRPSENDDYNDYVEPSIPIEPQAPTQPIKNILPDNKFSDELPALSSGRLGTMEISKTFVNYEISNISNETYGDYIQSLLDQGYQMNSDGTFTKGNYQIITSITQDGNMSIYLKLINL